MSTQAIGYLSGVFSALWGLLLICGIIGAGVALLRLFLSPGDDARTASSISHFGQICGISAAIGAVGLIAQGIFFSVGDADMLRFISFSVFSAFS